MQKQNNIRFQITLECKNHRKLEFCTRQRKELAKIMSSMNFVHDKTNSIINQDNNSKYGWMQKSSKSCNGDLNLSGKRNDMFDKKDPQTIRLAYRVVKMQDFVFLLTNQAYQIP